MEKAIKMIMIWATTPTAYLSESTPYAKGYKEGIENAHKTVIEIIKKCKEEKNANSNENENRKIGF